MAFIHPAAMFDLGKTAAKMKIKRLSLDKILHDSCSIYILQRIPGNSLPSAILNIAKTPVRMVKFRARLAPIAIFFFLRFISRAQYRTCTHAIVTGQALRKRKRALPCRIFFKMTHVSLKRGHPKRTYFLFYFFICKTQ